MLWDLIKEPFYRELARTGLEPWQYWFSVGVVLSIPCLALTLFFVVWYCSKRIRFLKRELRWYQRLDSIIQTIQMDKIDTTLHNKG